MPVEQLNQKLPPEEPPQRRVKHRRSTIVDAPDGAITFEKQDETVKDGDGCTTQTVSTPFILPEGEKVAADTDVSGLCKYARKRGLFSRKPKCGLISAAGAKFIERCGWCGERVCVPHTRPWVDGQRYCISCIRLFILMIPFKLLWKAICWFAKQVFDFFNEEDDTAKDGTDHDRPVFVGDDHVDGDEGVRE